MLSFHVNYFLWFVNLFKRFFCFPSLFFLLFFHSFYTNPVKAQNQTILQEIQETGLLKVGVRLDAIPFGYRDNDNQIRGICFDLVQLIREKISRKINRNIITVNIITSTLYNRFDLVENREVFFECGPNTIRIIDDYDKITFSQPFFSTGIQFFTTKNKSSKLLDTKGEGLIIGVLRYTSTESFLREKYPLAEFMLFQGNRGSLRGIQAVTQGRIDAFADDGVLLLSESFTPSIRERGNERFMIFPPTPLTCENYGLILPSTDEDWRNLLNSVLSSKAVQEMINKWFTFSPQEYLSSQECP